MGTLRSSVFLKTIAFILHQIFFIITAVTLFIGITYWNYDDASFDIIEQDDFTKTNYYKRLVENEIYDLITYIDYCSKFHTDDSNQTERIVDIYDYVQNDRITGQTTISLGYSLQDLLTWHEGGFYYISDENELDNNSDPKLVETYPNTAGVSIPAYAQARQLDCLQIYETLESAAEKLSNEYTQYKQQVSLFKSNNTNLRYVAFNSDLQQYYSNMNLSGIEEGIQQIESLQTYVTLNSTTADFDSNIFYSNDRLNHYLNTLYMNNQNYILAIGVDTQFPALDIFHKENIRYNNFERWFQTLSKLLVISVIGYFLCFLYLSAAAGHKKGHEETALTPLERIHTEFLALIFLGGIFYLGWQTQQTTSGFSLPSIDPKTLMQLVFISLLASLLISICYLSFLRRLKAGILWKNSLFYTSLLFLRRLFHNKALAMKACILYIVTLIAALACIRFIGHPILILLLLAVFSLLEYRIIKDRIEKQLLIDSCQNIVDGNLEFQIDTKRFHWENRRLAETINQISLVLHTAIEDSIKNERLKTNLITNVSHDIKTPLTSIINYVSLLKDIPLENRTANQYIQILDDKSQRLKQLTEDLVEASKISSKNITLEKTNLNFVELIRQTSGEFYEKFNTKHLTLITLLPETPVIINADGRRIWRILENIYNNAYKYSLENTRIYAQLEIRNNHAIFSLKNISAEPLTTDAMELTKRFVRGDISRNTEGSGLGLSIAKDLTELHNGSLKITTNGDLFCVIITLFIE